MALYWTSDGPGHDSNPPHWFGLVIYLLACIVIFVSAWIGLGR